MAQPILLYQRAFHKKQCKESTNLPSSYALFAQNCLLTCKEWQTYIQLAGSSDLSLYAKALEQCSYPQICIAYVKEAKVQLESNLITLKRAIEITDQCVALCGLDWEFGEQICNLLGEFDPDQQDRLQKIKEIRTAIPPSLSSQKCTPALMKEFIAHLTSAKEDPQRIKAFLEIILSRNPLELGMWKVLLEFLQQNIPAPRLIAKTCKRALLAFPMNLDLCLATLTSMASFEAEEELEDFFSSHIQRYTDDNLVSMWMWRVKSTSDKKLQYSNAVSFIGRACPNANTWPIHLYIINWHRLQGDHSAARSQWETLISSSKQYQLWRYFAEDEKSHTLDTKVLSSIYKRALALCPPEEHPLIFSDWASSDPLNTEARIKSLCSPPIQSKGIEKKQTLFLSNLNFKVTKEHLENFFEKRKIPILQVRMPLGSGEIPRGFAYVDVGNEEDFAAALALDRTPLMGRAIYVTAYKEREQQQTKRKQPEGDNKDLQ